MGVYHWNSGGQYRGKPWEQDQLTDSQVSEYTCSVIDQFIKSCGDE